MVRPVPTPETKMSMAPSVSVPDLRSGRALMDRGIRRVTELLQQHVARWVGRHDRLGLEYLSLCFLSCLPLSTRILGIEFDFPSLCVLLRSGAIVFLAAASGDKGPELGRDR